MPIHKPIITYATPTTLEAAARRTASRAGLLGMNAAADLLTRDEQRDIAKLVARSTLTLKQHGFVS